MTMMQLNFALPSIPRLLFLIFLVAKSSRGTFIFSDEAVFFKCFCDGNIRITRPPEFRKHCKSAHHVTGMAACTMLVIVSLKL